MAAQYISMRAFIWALCASSIAAENGAKNDDWENVDAPWPMYYIEDIPPEWFRDRHDYKILSCMNNTDPLLAFDDLLFRARSFQQVGMSLTSPEMEDDQLKYNMNHYDEHVQLGYNMHWLTIRPYQHSLFNLWQFEQDLTEITCPLGFITLVFSAGHQSISTHPGVFPLEMFAPLKKKLANKIFGYLARCEILESFLYIKLDPKK